MKRLVCILVLASLGLGIYAQQDSISLLSQQDSIVLSTLRGNTLDDTLEVKEKSTVPIFVYWKEHDIFQHLDVSVTAGTTGIGIDLATPIGNYVQLRAGIEHMPHFSKTMKFDLTIKGQPVRRYDENGNRVETTFDKLKEFLYDFTGFDVDDHADMVGKPTMTNAKLLVDVFPFKNNKHWHVTAGFYWGASKFAEAENSTGTMVTLLSSAMYNSMYDKAVSGKALIDFSKFTDFTNVRMEFDQQVIDKFRSFGRLGFAVGYYSHDVYGTYATNGYHNETDEQGNVIQVEHQAGDTDYSTLLHEKGERYIVEPGEDCMVRVKAKSNAFKPYLGFGYGGNLLKKRDDWKVSFDVGALFWGGTPDLYVHDGTNLTKDVENISGQVGDYVKIFKDFKVYPVLSFRLTKRIF